MITSLTFILQYSVLRRTIMSNYFLYADFSRIVSFDFSLATTAYYVNQYNVYALWHDFRVILFGQLPLYSLRISTICNQLTFLNSMRLEKISVDSHTKGFVHSWHVSSSREWNISSYISPVNWVDATFLCSSNMLYYS